MIDKAVHSQAILPRIPAAGLLAVGGWVCRIFARGRRWQLANERLRREQARLQAPAEVAQETGDVRRRVLQAVSHELRTPLTTLSAHLEVLALDGDTSTEERRRYIRIAFAAARRLAELLGESRQFEELSISRAAFAPQSFQLVELAYDVAGKTNRVTNLRGVTFRFEHPHRVPLIVGDIRLLERVFDVLLKVAAERAAPQGQVLVRLLPQRDAMRVEVHGSKSESARTFATGLERGCPQPASAPLSIDFDSDVAVLRKILELHGQTIDCAQGPRDDVRFLFDLSLAPAARRVPSLLRSVTSVRAAGL